MFLGVYVWTLSPCRVGMSTEVADSLAKSRGSSGPHSVLCTTDVHQGSRVCQPLWLRHGGTDSPSSAGTGRCVSCGCREAGCLEQLGRQSVCIRELGVWEASM